MSLWAIERPNSLPATQLRPASISGVAAYRGRLPSAIGPGKIDDSGGCACRAYSGLVLIARSLLAAMMPPGTVGAKR